MRYILYCRKSTDTEDRQVLSLESQENELLEMAKANGLNVVKILRESMSAKSEGRPVFTSLLSEMKQKKADGILCWKLDRLARNMADAGQVIDMLQRGVIKEIRTHEAIHLPTDNVLMLAVQLGMANQYIRDLSENVKRGLRAKLERGEWPNRAPYGYDNDRTTNTVVPNKKTVPIVRRIFELYSSGQYSMREVAEHIHAEGFRTAKGTKISKSRIELTIKNPFYFGLMYRGGKYYAGKHAPIISKELFDRAQAVLQGTNRPKQYRHSFPLRGLLLCASCTCMYTASLKKGHEYYYCTNGKGVCSAHTRYLRSEPATALVADALEKICFDKEIIEIMYEAARERNADKFSHADAIQNRLQSQLDTLETQELAAFDASTAGLLRPELYERKMKQINSARASTEHDLRTLKAQDQNVTLELTKKLFEQANSIRERFLAAKPTQQKIIASEVLWNILVKDKETQEIRHKTPYDIMAKAPKNAELHTLLGVWDDVGTSVASLNLP